jgi:cell division initiation protein
MKVSPLDLRQQRFKTAFRGYDPVEVTSFLAAVADDYEQALRETDRLQQNVATSETALNEHREHEKNLRATLTTAQKLSDEIKASADLEAQRTIRDAESRAALIVEKANARVDELHRDIDRMKLKRKDVEMLLESTILTLRNTLEYVREQETRSEDDARAGEHDAPRRGAEQAPTRGHFAKAVDPKAASVA